MTTDNASTTADQTIEGGNATPAATTAPADTSMLTTTSTDSAPTDTTTSNNEPAVPESYEFKMPDGVELDQAAADDFTVIAKELKLTQEQAQKIADIGAAQAQRQREAHATMVESWVETVKTDKEIGGDKLQENLAVARKALDAFGTPELRDVLNATGLGNHPEIIKAFYKAGKAISEDKFVTGSPKGPETDIAKKLFPSMN
jgi:hypothetical protein